MFRHELPYTIIESTEFKDIKARLKVLKVTSAHFTNGTFAFGPEITIATTLAGFKHVLTQGEPNLPLIIAINSDESMRQLGKTNFQSQKTRADNIAKPLAEAFPDNEVIVMFYDGKTPNDLYAFLAKDNITNTLHKWGYGTQQNAPKIEGAEFFKAVYGYPLVDDLKPLCWSETPVTDQTNIHVADLRGKLITPDRKCLFMLPESLKRYQQIDLAATVSQAIKLREST